MSPEAKQVIILYSGSGASEERARKIVEFMGATAELMDASLGNDGPALRRLVGGCTALITSARSLAALAERLESGVDALAGLLAAIPHVFVYGFEATERHAAILQALSSGTLVGPEGLSDNNVTFQAATDSPRLLKQFSGLSIAQGKAAGCAAFVSASAGLPSGTLIAAEGRPVLVRIDRHGSELFLMASDEVADLDVDVAADPALLPWFSRLVPLMIFLRGALGDQVWHSRQSFACFIIDDPLLRRRYGFLDFAKLLEAVGPRRFAASIAFIPWNYRRSDRRIAKLFAGPARSLSVCVHGCDHTGAEFAAHDAELLEGKARLALNRMQAHAELSGVAFDEVMVFPQGLFSSQALCALNETGYLAAINTHLNPDGENRQLRLRELLDVAVTSFDGVPLFVRHYPRDVAEFAFDLFLGKPAFIVEHHGYFREGYAALVSFIEQLNAVDTDLQWASPGQICSRAVLMKTGESSAVMVRSYSNRMRIENSGSELKQYVLLRRISNPELPLVTVNGRTCESESFHDELKVSFSLQPGESAELLIAPARSKAASANRPDVLNARVMARRFLSEFRDNYVDTSRVLRGIVPLVRSAVGARSHSTAGN